VYKSLLKKECGVKVISTTESIEDDKFSVILEAMLEAMAEYYSLNLSEEVKKGMTEKAERGGYQTGPPFGYVMENKKLKILEKEAKIVNLIFRNYANRNMNMTQLARHLNNLGVRTKKGNTFDSRTIEYIINNPVYMGKTRWTPTGKINRNWNNPDTIISDGNHEPIVEVEIWDKAHERTEENREIHRRKEITTAKIYTWLKSIVKCADCGRVFTTYNKKYMQCSGYLKGRCAKSASIPIAKLEATVLEEIKKTYSGEIDINIVPSVTDTDVSLEYDVINEQLHRLSDKEDRIKRAYEDGIDTIEEYKGNKKRLTEERTNLKNSLEQLKDRIINHKHDGEIVSRITNVYDLLTDDTVDIEQKYQTAHLLINEIVYSKSEKTLKLTYK
jgi:hypothetical protein